jgi:DNA polymerase III delta prime subunit
MSQESPSPAEFGFAFMEFMRVIQAAVELPENRLVAEVREHLGVEPDGLPVTAVTFRVPERPNLQVGLDAVLVDPQLVGVPEHVQGRGGGFTALLATGQFPGQPKSTPVEHVDVEVGDGRVIRCLTSALILTRFEDSPLALMIGSGGGRMPPHMHGQEQVRVEGIAPDEDVVSRFFVALRAAMSEHNVFRGRIISFTSVGDVEFPPVPNIERSEIVLPAGVLDRLEQHAIGISKHAQQLRAAGRHLKRGVLLHGPPGTGKTLTISYLLGATAGRTSVILTGGSLGFIEAAFAIARELAPATVVLEDIDLVAAERTMQGGSVLFELLNQLEGLAEDADLLVVLTTNRPDVIEPALAARPGRVDLALEIPLPDVDGRRQLLELYARGIALDSAAEEELVARTDGVTGAFIKELMRQATLRAAVAGSDPTAADVTAIVTELLDERSALTRRLLGQGADGVDLLGGPPPHMARAVQAAGMRFQPRPPFAR